MHSDVANCNTLPEACIKEHKSSPLKSKEYGRSTRRLAEDLPWPQISERDTSILNSVSEMYQGQQDPYTSFFTSVTEPKALRLAAPSDWRGVASIAAVLDSSNVLSALAVVFERESDLAKQVVSSKRCKERQDSRRCT